MIVGPPGRLLITGATGFVGRHVLLHAIAAGFSVAATTRNGPPPWLSKMDDVSPHLQVLTDVDFQTPESLNNAIASVKPSVVVHCAASGARPGEFVSVGSDVDSLEILVEACCSNRVTRLVYLGSAQCYGLADGHHSELEPLAPVTPYGLAKAQSSLFANYYQRAGFLDIVELRLFNVYGPGDDPRRVVPYIISAALNNAPIELKTGRFERDFVFVNDVVRAIMAAANTLPSGIYNVSTGQGTAIETLARMVIDITASQSALTTNQSSFKDHPKLIGSCERLAVHGFEPRTNLYVGLNKTIEAAKFEMASSKFQASA